MPKASARPVYRPKIFVGSSVEGLSYAETIQLNLQFTADCQLWNQSLFAPTTGTLEQLVTAVGTFDFAIFVITPDDVTTRRGTRQSTGRDNVIFELGLFMGRLGRERTFIVQPRDQNLSLPSDLLGVTTISFQHSTATPLAAAMGAACTQIAQHIRTPSNYRSEKHDRGDKEEVGQLENRLSLVEQSLRDLVSATEKSRIPLTSLEGAWRGFPTGSHGYGAMVGDEFVLPYCYGGNETLTGFYHSFKSHGETLTARFNWVTSDISGYAYFDIRSRDQLDGGWWYRADVTFDNVQELAVSRESTNEIQQAMYAVTFLRQKKRTLPSWAKAALKQWPKFRERFGH